MFVQFDIFIHKISVLLELLKQIKGQLFGFRHFGRITELAIMMTMYTS